MNSSTMTSSKWFLTVPEFAERYGVSVNTAYKMLAEGTGPRIIRSRGNGGAIRIPIVAFDEWVATAGHKEAS